MCRVERCSELGVIAARNCLERRDDLDKPRLSFVTAAHEFADIEHKANRIVLSPNRSFCMNEFQMYEEGKVRGRLPPPPVAAGPHTSR